MKSRYSIPIFAHQHVWPLPVNEAGSIDPDADCFTGFLTHQSISINLFWSDDDGSAPIPTQALALLMPDLPMTIFPKRYCPIFKPGELVDGELPDHWAHVWGPPTFRSTPGHFAARSIRANFLDPQSDQEITFFLHDCVVVEDHGVQLPIILGGDFFHDPYKHDLQIHLMPAMFSPQAPFALHPRSTGEPDHRHHHRHLARDARIGAFQFSVVG